MPFTPAVDDGTQRRRELSPYKYTYGRCIDIRPVDLKLNPPLP